MTVQTEAAVQAEDLVIRLADFDAHVDAAGIVQIVNEYATDPLGGGVSLSSEICARIVPGLKATPGAFAFLAIKDGQPVGAAICFLGFSTFAAMPLVNVHDLSVLKSHRSQGIGRKLLAAVEAFAKSQGCAKVTLEVRENNPLAERLYRRLGYADPSGIPTWFLDKSLL